MLSLSLTRHSARLVVSSSSSFSPSFFSSFSRAPAPTSFSPSPLATNSLSFSRKPFQTNPNREEKEHPRFDFLQGGKDGDDHVDRHNFLLYQKIHDLEEEVELIKEENERLKGMVNMYKGTTREGTDWESSPRLPWLVGLLRNGPLNLFYVHHPLTNEVPLNDQRKDTHIGAWGTLGALTALQAFILYLWTEATTRFDEEVHKSKNPDLNDEERQEIFGECLKAVDSIRWMEENFMTSSSAVDKHGRWWSLLTACVSHSNLSHFLGNMVAMWLFGFKLLRVIGPARFLALFSVGGVFASYCQNVFTSLNGGTEEMPDFLVRCQEDFDVETLDDPKYDLPCLGASGSVLAMAGAASLFFPRDMVIVRFVPFPLPFPIAAGIYFMSDLVGVTHPDFLRKLVQGDDPDADNYNPRVGHAAHMGGMAFGVLFSLLLLRGRKPLPRFSKPTTPAK